VLAKQITSGYMLLFRWLMSIQYLYRRLTLSGLFANKKWMLFWVTTCSIA